MFAVDRACHPDQHHRPLANAPKADGRHIEVYTDEGHYWMKLVMLILGMIRGIKVWRKLGIWLIFGTQDFSDFHEDARKILSQAEFWWLLSMGEDEAQQISRFKSLSPEEHYLIRQAKIEKPNYTEGHDALRPLRLRPHPLHPAIAGATPWRNRRR